MSTTPSPAPGGLYPLAGRDVPRIGYGMRQLASQVEGGRDRASAVALLRRAHELGVRHFDTAQFYGKGMANGLLREAFGSDRGDVKMATKAGARPVSGGPAPMVLAQTPADIRAAVEENLTALATDRLDLVNLRRADFGPGLLAEGEQVVPLDDQLAELVALRAAGKVGAIGLSQVTHEQVERALPAGISCVQNIYYLLDRSFEPTLALCREAGVAWVPYFQLGGGGAYFRLPRVVEDPVVLAVAAELGATPSQVGLAWQLAHAPNTMLIAGTGSLDHLAENVAAGDLVLDEDTLARLEADRPSATVGSR